MSATLHDTAADRRKATRREWIGLAVVALPCLVYAMDLTVLNLALPVLSRELQPSSAQLLWILDIYGFFVAGFLITMGTLGDRIGRRRLLLIGAALFAFASVLAALADTAALLIAARALLGLAGATIAPSTMALIRNMFHDPRQRQFAIGVWIAAFSLGSAIGPLVGGVLLEFFHWGAVFWLNVPMMLLTLALGPRFLPEYRDPDAGHLDLASVLLSLAAVLLTIYGLKQLAEHGAGLASMAALLAGLAVGALFLRRQGHIAYPLLDLRLFAHAPFRAALAAYALAALAMFGVYIFMTQYLQLVLGLSPLQAGQRRAGHRAVRQRRPGGLPAGADQRGAARPAGRCAAGGRCLARGRRAPGRHPAGVAGRGLAGGRTRGLHRCAAGHGLGRRGAGAGGRWTGGAPAAQAPSARIWLTRSRPDRAGFSALLAGRLQVAWPQAALLAARGRRSASETRSRRHATRRCARCAAAHPA